MSQLLRTYSRKGKRASRDASTSTNASPERVSGVRKRQKISVEVVDDDSSSSYDEARHGGPGSRASSDGRISMSNAPQPPRRSTSIQHSSIPTESSSSLLTASKLRRTVSLSPVKSSGILADLFSESVTRASSPKPTVGGVAKRMLRRTNTDASIGSSSGLRFTAPIENSGAQQRTPKRLTPTRTDPFLDPSRGSPSSPSSRQLTPGKSRSYEESGSPDKDLSRPMLTNSHVRTYAGKSRSFLIALPTSHTSSLAPDSVDKAPTDVNSPAVDTPEDDFESRESYADLRARWGVDNSEDDPYPVVQEVLSPPSNSRGKGKQVQKQPSLPQLPPGMMNDLKSITELRSKGESRRFVDEMGYLFEGLDPDGVLAVRRGSALEIVTKMCDAEFARKAKAADFFSRAWEGLRSAGAGQGDKVLDTVAVFFAALVSRDPVDLTDLSTRTDMMSELYTMLSRLTSENDPLWLVSCGLPIPAPKSRGMSRNDLLILQRLHKMVLTKSNIFGLSELISSRLLISLSLASIPSSFNNARHLPVLLSSLQAEFTCLSSRISAYVAGLSIIPPLSIDASEDILSFSHINNCLLLLESFLLGRWQDDDDEQLVLDAAREGGLGSSLLSLCVAADALACDEEAPELVSIAYKCMESAFRVLVNLTHDNLPWCQASIGSHSGLSSIMRLLATCNGEKVRTLVNDQRHEALAADTDDDAAQCLDRLCLILALLTNLVQISDEAKETIHAITLNTQCPGKRRCALACRCPTTVTGTECLAEIYAQQCRSDNDFDCIVRGHLAVLFGLIMQDHLQNQMILLRVLPGPSRKKKVESLMENAREFSLFYVEFVKKAGAVTQDQNDDDFDGQETFAVKRLGHLNGHTVVNQVLDFLEGLRRDL